MDTARSWMLRINEPGFDSWEDFTSWLEAEPGHLQAYEAALEDDAWARDLLDQAAPLQSAAPSPIAPVDQGEERHTRSPSPSLYTRRAFGGAIAACLMAVLGWATFLRGPDIEQITTGPGEHRSIALADGSRLVVNGNSSISFDPDQPRRITLAHGEALFDVYHDAADPFIVTVGNTRLIDEGTIFNVIHDDGALDVAVAEGLVVYNHADENVLLEPGDRLVRAQADGPVEVRDTAIDVVGTWRTGLLHYSNAPLSEVAADLSRALGKPVRAVRGAERIRYTGTLAVDGGERALLDSAGALLGVRITETSDTWEMTPVNAPPR